MTAPRRRDRMAEFVRQEVAKILLAQMRDPRLEGVVVTRADVSDDIQHAKIFVRVIGTEGKARAALKALQGAAGKIQGELGSQLQTRYTPRLQFLIDEDVEKERRMSELFRQVEAELGESAPPAAGPEAGDAEGPGPEAT